MKLVKVYVTGESKFIPGKGTRHAGEFFELSETDAQGYATLDGFSLSDPNAAKPKKKLQPKSEDNES